MQLAVDLFGMPELPLGGFCWPAEVIRHIADRPDIESLYEFLHDTADLLRVRAQSIDSFRTYLNELFDKTDQF